MFLALCFSPLPPPRNPSHHHLRNVFCSVWKWDFIPRWFFVSVSVLHSVNVCVALPVVFTFYQCQRCIVRCPISSGGVLRTQKFLWMFYILLMSALHCPLSYSPLVKGCGHWNFCECFTFYQCQRCIVRCPMSSWWRAANTEIPVNVLHSINVSVALSVVLYPLGGVLRTRELSSPLLRVRSCQRFPLLSPQKVGIHVLTSPAPAFKTAGGRNTRSYFACSRF